MRVFVDDAYVECYFMDGRRVITWGKTEKEKPTAADGDGVAVSAFANGALELKSAVAWEVSSIWVGLGDIM